MSPKLLLCISTHFLTLWTQIKDYITKMVFVYFYRLNQISLRTFQKSFHYSMCTVWKILHTDWSVSIWCPSAKHSTKAGDLTRAEGMGERLVHFHAFIVIDISSLRLAPLTADNSQTIPVDTKEITGLAPVSNLPLSPTPL